MAAFHDAAIPLHTVKVDGGRATHVSPLALGCHLDVYGHQLRALSSQMLIDESFEAEQANASSSTTLLAPWEQRRDRVSQNASIQLDSDWTMHGLRSMRITVQQGAAGLANRGQFAHGLALAKGRTYEGLFFASRHSCPGGVTAR